MKTEYRLLRKGEIIKETDEFLDELKIWRKSNCAGQSAPAPEYSNHCIYRRKINVSKFKK